MGVLAEAVTRLRAVVARAEALAPRSPSPPTAPGASSSLDPAQQQAVRDALASAGSADERSWIRAGVASGLGGTALTRYLARLRTMTSAQLADLHPPTDGSFSQPDQTTCGPSALVMSRLRHRPAYALWMRTGYDVGTATATSDPRTPEQRFADEVLAMHRRTNALRGRDGALQLPWPRALGTQPWALAAEMSSEGGSGAPGRTYAVRTVVPSDRGATHDAIVDAVASGTAVPLYVGSTTRPGHVVLVTGSEDGVLVLYDPATGQEKSVTRDDLTRGRLRISGWDEPWFAVLAS